MAMLMLFQCSTSVISHEKELRFTTLFKNTVLCFVGKSELLPALQGGRSPYLVLQPRFLITEQMLIRWLVLRATCLPDTQELSAGQQQRCHELRQPSGRVTWGSSDLLGPCAARAEVGAAAAAGVLTAGVAVAAASPVLWVHKGIDPFICFGLPECKRIN